MRITRNDIELDFVSHEITKGKTKGKKFFGVDVTQENFGAISQFFGDDFILSKVGAAVRQLCIAAYMDSCDSDGNSDPDKFVNSIQNAKVTSSTMSELKEQQQTLLAEFTSLNFSDPNAVSRAGEIQKELMELNTLIEARKRQPRVTEDDDEETPASQPAQVK